MNRDELRMQIDQAMPGFHTETDAAIATKIPDVVLAVVWPEIERLSKDLGDARDHLASARQFRESERDYQRLMERAHQAEAAIERVRRIAQVWVDIRPSQPTVTREGHVIADAGQQILDALDQPAAKEVKEDPSSPEAAS